MRTRLKAAVLLGTMALAGSALTQPAAEAAQAAMAMKAVEVEASWEMNEPAGATTMVDSGPNGLHAPVNQSGLDTGFMFGGAIGYSWPRRPPNEPPASPERVIAVPDNLNLDPLSDTYTVEIRFRTREKFGNITQKGQATTRGGQWKIQNPQGRPSCLFKGSITRGATRAPTAINDNLWHTLRCVKTPTAVSCGSTGCGSTARAVRSAHRQQHPDGDRRQDQLRPDRRDVRLLLGRDRLRARLPGQLTGPGMMTDLVAGTFLAIVAAGFLVGVIVGLTGMGGGALMTPALIFLGVGDAPTVVTADLTAAAVYKTGGALVHKREGSPNMALAGWLVAGSVPMALLGPYLISWVAPPGDLDRTLKLCIGFALLMAALTYALRLYINLRRIRTGEHFADDRPVIRPLPTLLVGALGGLLVGVTSVGSGSVIMIALLMLYPGLSAVRLVGTDLVQAVPLVLAAAISNIALHGLDLAITVPLILGSVPGTILGSLIAPRVPQSFVRRGIVVVLTMSGVALLDKAGWAPLGAGEHETHPVLIIVVGLVMVVLVPLVWGALRHSMGLPVFGSPTLAELEDPTYRPRGWRAPRAITSGEYVGVPKSGEPGRETRR